MAADLSPHTKLTFGFPELPKTLEGMASRMMRLTQLEAILSSNFVSTSQHPLFVYIKVGRGRREDAQANARDIANDQDFIVVHASCFKKNPQACSFM